MPNTIFRSLAICVALLSAGPALASCPPFGFKNATLDKVRAGTFESRNGEFEFQLPFARQRVTYGSFGHKCFYAINIDSLVSGGHRSIEWVYLDEAQTDEAFLAYWEGFLDDYLAKNFGSGGYTRVAMAPHRMADGRQAIRYVGSGTNNGGKPGAIRGVAMVYGQRMANVYSITQAPVSVPTGADAFDDPEVRSVEAMANSLVCGVPRCRRP